MQTHTQTGRALTMSPYGMSSTNTNQNFFFFFEKDNTSQNLNIYKRQT